MKVPLPFTGVVEQVMVALSGEGEGEKDHGAIIKFWEELSQVEVK